MSLDRNEQGRHESRTLESVALRAGLVRFQRVWAVFALGLLLATWKLWTPQTDFPQIPFFGSLVDIPGIVDWVLLAAVVVSLLLNLFTHSDLIRRASLFWFALFAIGLISLNQHRLQPWAYQFVVFALVMALARPKRAIGSMRLIVVSIYIFSAASKFDYQFVHSVGDQMLTTFSGLLGLNAMDWSDGVRQRLVLGMPIGELLVGCGLLFPKTRKFAVVMAVLLHAVLLAILLKLGHSPGVICWNLYFICQAVLLFGWGWLEVSEKTLPADRGTDSGASSGNEGRYPFDILATTLTGFVLLFPLTQSHGICDHWVAWEVYSPRTSRAATNLVQGSDTPLSQDTLAWSEATLFVPVYPQARFQLAVAMADLQDYDEGYSITVKGVADRWTGNRETETLTGTDLMKMRASKFWLNTAPRKIWKTRNVR